MGLVPFRLYVMPTIFSNEELALLDNTGAELGEVADDDDTADYY